MTTSSLHYQAVYNNLLRSFHQTKTHLSITNLKSPNPEIFSAILQKTTKKLQTTKLLRKLTLDLRGIHLDQTFRQHIYRNLIKEIPDFQHLNIVLSKDPAFQNQAFEFFLKILKLFRGLKTIEVGIPARFEQVSQKYLISDLPKALKKSAPRLQEAKFFLADETEHSPAGLPVLEEWRMNRLVNLQKLTLYLPKSVFLNKENLDLASLKRIKRLKSFDVSISDLRADPQKTVFRGLAFDPSEIFPNLRHFKWDIISDIWQKTSPLELLGPLVASRLRCLEDFGMRFQQNSDLTDREIKGTVQYLTSLEVDLHQLSVMFAQNDLTQNGTDALIMALTGPRLQNMHTICLEFVGCKGMNGAFVDRLTQTLCQNMKKLRALRLSFEFSQARANGLTGPLAGFEGLADQEISRLGVVLTEGCENLELVSLEFWRYSHISDKGARSLCESLSKIKSLKTARLQFKFCPKVSSISVRHAKEKFGPQRDVKFTTI